MRLEEVEEQKLTLKLKLTSRGAIPIYMLIQIGVFDDRQAGKKRGDSKDTGCFKPYIRHH